MKKAQTPLFFAFLHALGHFMFVVSLIDDTATGTEFNLTLYFLFAATDISTARPPRGTSSTSFSGKNTKLGIEKGYYNVVNQKSDLKAIIIITKKQLIMH